MPEINYKKTTIILSAVLAFELYCEYKNARTIEVLNRNFRNAAELSNLYARKLNDHKIQMDPFETIIMYDAHNSIS